MYTVTLNNGVEMPVIGFGTYHISDPKECERCIIDAIDIGYRLIDTAAMYQNEQYIGKAIKKCGVPRDELFISTKLSVSDNHYDAAKKAIDRQLSLLQSEYLDMFLIHHPYNDVYGAWRALEEAYHAGKVRAIGVANFEPYRLMDLILNNEIVPAVNQVEAHPLFQQQAVKKVMEEFDVRLVASRALARGNTELIYNEKLDKLAARHNKTIGQIILRWHLQSGHIALPKTVHKDRMYENFDIFDFSLTQEEMDIFQSLDTGKSVFFDRYHPERVRQLCAK